jgi:hypothetical protein
MIRTGVFLVLLAGVWPRLAGAQEARVRYDRDLITREEIQDRAPDSKTALDVVQRLRPHFLRERSAGRMSSALSPDSARTGTAVRQPVQAYVNGARGTTASLRNIQAAAVIDILYLNAADATTRFGTGHDNGAIVVRLGN